MKYRTVFIVSMVLILLGAFLGQPCEAASQDETVFNDPETLVQGFFASVSFGPGTTPDWDQETVEKSKFKTPADAPGQIGLDNYSLMKKDGRWWIVSITNEIPTPQRPLPEDLW